MVEVLEPLNLTGALDVYEHLVPYFERIKHRAEGIEPEDLRLLIANDCVTLHPIGDEGYIIASWEDDEMFVISAGSFSLHCSNMPEYISAAVRYAKKRNCSKMSFKSKRPAWRRIAIGFGFVLHGADYYTKDL